MSDIIPHFSIYNLPGKRPSRRVLQTCQASTTVLHCIPAYGFAGSRAFYNRPPLALVTWPSLHAAVLTPPCRQFGGRKCAITTTNLVPAYVIRYTSPVREDLYKVGLSGIK
jgi:hypothetical protein